MDFFSTVPHSVPVQLVSGSNVPHPSSHQLHPEILELYCIMRKFWSCRVWSRCLSTMMGVIQCVGSTLLSLVGLVYGCVLIMENQSSEHHLSSEMLLPMFQTTSVPCRYPKRAERDQCDENAYICAAAMREPASVTLISQAACQHLAEWYLSMVAVTTGGTEQFQQTRSPCLRDLLALPGTSLSITNCWITACTWK